MLVIIHHSVTTIYGLFICERAKNFIPTGLAKRLSWTFHWTVPYVLNAVLYLVVSILFKFPGREVVKGLRFIDTNRALVHRVNP